MGSDENFNKKRPLTLDFDTLLGDEEPREVEIVKRSKLDGTENSSNGGGGVDKGFDGGDDGFEGVTDNQIEQKIKSTNKTYHGLGKSLPDKGEKLLKSISKLEAELERRKALKVKLAAKESQKPSQPTSSSITGIDGSTRETSPPFPTRKAVQHAHQFCATLENAFSKGKKSSYSTSISLTGAFGGPRLQTSSPPRSHGEPESAKQFSEGNETDRRTTNAFQKELSFFRPGLRNVVSEVSQKRRRGGPIKSTSSFSSNDHSAVRRRGIFSTSGVDRSGKNLLRCFNKKDSSLVPRRLRPRKEPTYFLVDEDEPELLDMNEEEEENELYERMKEAKIHYPSRVDQESIEICYPDTKCLAPESYLSSTIISFYIRFLQQEASATPKTLSNYHFFNTYFYNKLKDAISYKGCDKEASFIKFRRWWKGVQIFHKAYLLIPIHEDQHWSLVIICMPEKEDDAGPTVLHLDSLGLHNSKTIFYDIKSYLIEEWNFLRQDGAPTDLPFADRIWENLPLKIVDKKLPVPQQKNDYDCGLFVLFFIERFIQEAPERLRKNNLAMFGKQWFEPEEASGLRRKIRTLLKNEFKTASEGMDVQKAMRREV